jgi:uncharacterized membrane protein (UPF0127 family)
MNDPGQGPPEDLAQPAPAGAVEVVTGLSKAYKTWLVGVGFVLTFVLILLWGSNRPANPTFADTASASSSTTTVPGPAFAEKKIGVGASCLRVMVADTAEKRAQGLRNRDNIDGFDGMVFEFDFTQQNTKFTMSGVRFPLTIGFYDESGLRVDATDMELCTAGGDGSCPAYGSKAPFRTAVETPKGKLPEGPLTACPAA